MYNHTGSRLGRNITKNFFFHEFFSMNFFDVYKTTEKTKNIKMNGGHSQATKVQQNVWVHILISTNKNCGQMKIENTHIFKKTVLFLHFFFTIF